MSPRSTPEPKEGVVVSWSDGRRVQTLRLSGWRGRWGLRLWFGVQALLVAGWWFGWPRVTSHAQLAEDNLDLRRQLHEVAERLDDADEMLERLRLYDAELRALTEPRGDHGPIPKAAWEEEGEDFELLDDALGEVAHEVVATEDVSPPDAPPAAQWSEDVAGRLGRFVERFRLSEPDLNALVSDLEMLRAIRESLPSVWPADGVFTSGYGWRRDPYRRSLRFHAGVDIANGYGTPVKATASGTVARATRTSGYGHVVEIDHGFGIMTRYAHLSRRRVSTGDLVERGDLIGTMGSTGRSTGPHLHFELHVDGNTLDPLPYLPR